MSQPLRVTKPELLESRFPENLLVLARRLGLQAPEIDIILDLKELTGDMPPPLAQLLENLPELTDWRTLTVASGAFPQNLSGLEPGRRLINRRDWTSWKAALESEKSLIRQPSFGDYTIQHPVYTELNFLPNYSASIRYTIENHWLVMRGQGVRTPGSAGFAQWPALAHLLCERPEFCGGEFSEGDEYIFSKGQDIRTRKTGNAKTWLEAGFNHHVTFVALQLHAFSEQILSTTYRKNKGP